MKRFNALAAALFIAVGASAAHAQTLGFIDDQPVRNDLQGTLPGMVKFAQSHTIDPNGNAALEQPMLVTEREAMVMFLPQAAIPTANWSQLRLDVFVKGKLMGELVLAPPEVFPLSDRPVRDARPDVLYSTKAWTTRIPWQWVRPGMSLRFRYQGKVGDLTASNVEFSAPAELTLQNIRIGMLAPPPAASTNRMETALAEAAIDYFQKVPVSRLTIGQYLPVTLDRIVMPNGNVYTTASPDNGEPHFGDMREDIGKALISIGINNANFGIVDSAGRSQQYHDHFRQITMHQSVGRYANGVIQHGLSGGGGMATLYELRGNEFSHELGHNFGLGHWPGGGRWSSHNATSGWGYDAFRDRMLANLAWTPKASDNVIEDYTTPAYKGLYAFGRDPMASGEPDSALSEYTLHTGYTAKRVQENLAASPIVYPTGVTGHARWDAATQSIVADRTKQKPTHFGVPVVTLVGYYDPQGVLPSTIYPAMYGNHGQVYALPTPTISDCRLDVTHATQAMTSIRLASARHAANEMNKFHVNVPASSQPKTAAVSCIVDGAHRELHRMTIAAPSAALPPALKVGREEGFLHAALRLPGIWTFAGRKPVSSRAELEAKIERVYGELQDISSSGVGRAGATYRFDNPVSPPRVLHAQGGASRCVPHQRREQRAVALHRPRRCARELDAGALPRDAHQGRDDDREAPGVLRREAVEAVALAGCDGARRRHLPVQQPGVEEAGVLPLESADVRVFPDQWAFRWRVDVPRRPSVDDRRVHQAHAGTGVAGHRTLVSPGDGARMERQHDGQRGRHLPPRARGPRRLLHAAHAALLVLPVGQDEQPVLDLHGVCVLTR
jgi:hypothetical protein